VDPTSITDFIRGAFANVHVFVATEANAAPKASWGDTFFFYGTDRRYPMPCATIVTHDYPGHDTASDLNRPGIFRLNIGLSRENFAALFGENAESYDFRATDLLMPHPVYAGQSWVCILNPSDATFTGIHPLLQDAYSHAVKMTERRST
jgi:hypothetical protein